jgi:hypothetical protein
VRKEQFTARELYVARDRKTVEFIQTLGRNRTDGREERRISSTRIVGHMAGAELSGLPVVHVRQSQTNAVLKELSKNRPPQRKMDLDQRQPDECRSESASAYMDAITPRSRQYPIILWRAPLSMRQ